MDAIDLTIASPRYHVSAIISSAQSRSFWGSSAISDISERDSLGRSKQPRSQRVEEAIPSRMRVRRPAFDSTTFENFGSLLQNVRQQDRLAVKEVYIHMPKAIEGKWSGSHRTRRMLSELKTACTWANWLSIAPIDSNFNNCLAIMAGTLGTPYEGVIFWLQVKFPQDYPFRPPSMRFLTNVWHPNIDERGNICLDTLQDGWTAAHTMASVLASVHLLFSEPAWEDPLRGEVARQWYEDCKGFVETAKRFTEVYANGQRPGVECLDSED